MNEQRTYTVYFPLWGVNFDSDEFGLVGGNVIACKPFEAEWRKLLNYDLLIEYSRYHQQNILGVTPQLCLCITFLLAEDEDLMYGVNKYGEALNLPISITNHPSLKIGDFPEPIQRNLDDIYTQISDAVLTLRLLKAGWFHDPMLIEFSFMSSDANSQILRYKGPYRQLFLAGIDNRFPPFYELGISELARIQNESSPSTIIWDLIQKHRRSGGNDAVDIAVRNFNNAYSLIGNVSFEQKVGFLFTALDSILGGMSLVRKGNKEFLVRTEMKVRFKERILEIFRLLNFDNAEAEAAWMESLRNMRNPIAHGTKKSMEQESEKIFERLLSAVRKILRHYIAFSTNWNNERKNIAECLGIEEGKSLVEAYNKTLEKSSLGKLPNSILSTMTSQTP